MDKKKQQRLLLLGGGGLVLLFLAYRFYQSRSSGGSGSSSGVSPDEASTLQGQEASDYSSLAGQEQSDIAKLANQQTAGLQRVQKEILSVAGNLEHQIAGNQAAVTRQILKLTTEEHTLERLQAQAAKELAHQRQLEKKLRADIKKVMKGEASGKHDRHPKSIKPNRTPRGHVVIPKRDRHNPHQTDHQHHKHVKARNHGQQKAVKR